MTIGSKEEAQAIFEKWMEEPLLRVRTIGVAVIRRDGFAHTRTVRPELDRLGLTDRGADERWYNKMFDFPFFEEREEKFIPLVDGERTRKHETRHNPKPISTYRNASRFENYDFGFDPLAPQPCDPYLREVVVARALAQLSRIASKDRHQGHADVEVLLRTMSEESMQPDRLYTLEEVADFIALTDWKKWGGGV